jgi:hypothetical protein
MREDVLMQLTTLGLLGMCALGLLMAPFTADRPHASFHTTSLNQSDER